VRIRALGRSAATAIAATALLGAALARAECRSGLDTKLIPLPVYATLPNEGNTFGAMPVFLRICPDDQRTESIIAPSVTWNSVIHYTATLRWFEYPSDDESLTVIGSASTRINHGGLVVWQRRPEAPGLTTDDVTLRLQRTAFTRFFGLGPDTSQTAESTYTRFRLLASARRGVNLASHLNVGATLAAERDGVEAVGVPGLPLTREVFPAVPGIHGATLLSEGADLRYDDRRGGDYADRGVRAEIGGAVVEGLDASPTFLRGGAQVSAIFPEVEGLSGAARLAWTGVSSRRAPFFAQSTLGGSFVMRGFTEDRFIDRQAWTAEVEQRIRLFQTHIFGVVADWRADPFVAAGQVFGPLREAFSRPQIAAGVGFRAFVHPNVLGRVDVASGGEGIKVYVELGYPY
jgi:hypothetical protein